MSMFIVILFGLLMVAGGIAALYVKDTVSAIITAGSVSLVASLLYLILGAPDVAMTEAAIGSALTTVVFLFSWSRIQSHARRAASGAKQEAEPKTEEREDNQL